MKDKHPHPSDLTPAELHLIERLREHPELIERFDHILEITATTDGTVKRADEIESLLIEEMRRLAMPQWEAGPAKPKELWPNN